MLVVQVVAQQVVKDVKLVVGEVRVKQVLTQ